MVTLLHSFERLAHGGETSSLTNSVHGKGGQVRIITTLCACMATLAMSAFAAEGPVPAGVPNLQHVWVIMMENHGYGQVVGNPNMPYVNDLIGLANTATNYFAIAHPSLTNYLEVVGGSNFGVLSDNNPDWHNFCLRPQPHCPGRPIPTLLPRRPSVRSRERDPTRRLSRWIPPMRPPALPVLITSTALCRSRQPQTPLAKPSPISSPKPGAPGKAIRRACHPKARTI